MAIRVKVVPASESISSDTAATTVRNDVVTLQQSSNVALDIDPDQVAGYVKDGQDLVVQLKTGENVRIVNFYAEGQSPSHLFLVDDKKLVAVDLPVVASDGPLAASYLPQETLAGFDSLTAAGAGSGISGAMVLGGLAAVGAAVALADSGGGGGSPNPPQNPPVPDTTPPAAPTGLAFSADGRTLTGSGEVGATVRVDTNGDGQPDATGTVGADGRFSVTLSPPLTNGEKVSVTLVDAAGNVSGPGQATAPDTTPPAAASNVVVADDGSSISGSGEPGATVGVDTDGDGQPDATVVIGGDGQFTVPLDPPLTQGETISVVVTDPAGNSSPPVTVQAPDYPDAPLVNASNGSVISGTAGAGLTILLTDGDGNPIGQTVADASGNWSFTPPAALADGTVVTAVAQNTAGNTSPATSVTIDGVAPAAPVIDPSNGTAISGTAEAGSTVTLTDGNGNPIGQVTTDGDGHWSFTPGTPLPDGTVVNATATDPAGNTSGQGSTTVDAVAPSTPTVQPSNGGTLAGTAEPGSTVVLTDGNGNPIAEVAVDGSGNWSYTPGTPLPDGTVVTVVAEDAAGNSSPPATVTVDSQPPAAPVLEASNGTSLSGTAEPGSTVTLTDGSGNPIGQVTADGNGDWSFTPATPLPNGTVVNASATDATGNTGPGASIIVDAVAPAAPVVLPSNGTSISGTAEPGSTVTLTDGSGTSIGQTTADGNGNWSFTPATPLPDGAVINATATDAAGNTGGQGGTTVDAVPPAAPVLNLSNGSAVTGTAEPGSRVILTDGNGDPIASVTVDGSGNWSYTPATPLPNGTVVNAVAVDGSGNASAGSSVTIDSQAPAAPVLDVSNGTLIVGTAEPGSTVTLTDGNGNPIGQVTTNGNGDWTFTPVAPLPDGTVINATATDATGNTSAPSSITVDAVAPAAPVVNPSNGITLTGTAEPGSVVTLIDGSGNPFGQAPVDSNGNWSFPLATPLPDGSVVSATATDASGNTSGATSITVDALAPAAPVLNPSNGNTVSGTAEPNSKIILTDGNGGLIAEVTVDGSGNWSYTPATPLPDGTVVTAVAVDAAGNTSPPATVSVDASAPPAPVIDPSNGTTVSGTAEAGSTVILTDGSGNPIGQVTADGSGNWSFTPGTPLPDGTVIVATATDATGNTGPQAAITVDALPPPAPVLDPSNGTTITGTAEAGATVILTDGNGNPIGQTTADGSGNWSFTPATALPDGTVVNAVAQDAAGNTGPQGSTTVDAVAPPTPVVNASNGNVLTGTAEPNSTVTLTDGNGNPIGQATVDGSGNWSFSPATPLPDGTVVNVTATDAAGNTSAPASTTVDSSLPSIPLIDPSNGSVISGTADPGNTVIITDGSGNPIGQVTADGSGNWSFTPGVPLPDGTVVNVIARSPSGVDSAPAAITIDGVAPPAPVVDPSNGAEISGTAEANAIIVLTDGSGTLIGQTTADGSGNWSFTPATPLPDGTVVNAIATDPAGNSSGPASITVDALAPPAPVINASNGVVISGTAEAGATVVLTDGNGAPIGQTTADGSGNWSFTPATALPDGTVITAVAQDAAGNTSGPASTTVDAVAPPAPVIDPSNGSIISGTAEAGATVILTDGNGDPIGQAIADGSGNWSFTPGAPLPDGTVINAIAQDVAGNSSGPASTTVDAVAPPAPVINASNGAVISGTAEAGATVILTDGNGDPIGQATADGSGNWSFTPGTPLPDGTVITAVAQDAAGNASGPATTTVDTVAPPAPVIDPSNGSVVSGTAEAGATVILTDGSGNPIGQTTADGAGNWSYTPATPLPNGTVITAVAQDAAGNGSDPASTTVDSVAPPAPTIDASNGSVISGTAEAGATVILTDGNGIPIGQTIADGSGNWSFTPGTPLPDGTVINALARDAAGNNSSPVSTTVDAVAPSAPTLDASNGTVITGTVEPGVKVILTDGNGDPIGEAIADGSGNWSFTPATPLPDGTVINAIAQDAAGNNSGPVSTTVDAVAPPAPVIDPSNGSVISGTAEAGATVILTDGNGDPIGLTTADGSGNWSFTPGAPLPDGTVINAVAQDAAGNTSGPVSTTVDAVAPPAPVIDPSNGSVISGTAEAGATVILTDGSGNPIGQAIADGSGNWSFSPATPLPDGTVINAVAQDAAGNTSGPATTTVDAVAPPAPVIDPSNGSVISGAAEAGATVILTDGNGDPIGQAIADGSGNWSFTPATPLPDGTVINAVAQDAAGNTSGPASTTVDAVAPPAPVIDPSNGSVIAGTAEAGATVILTDGNGDPIGQAIVDGSGNWSFTPGAPLPDGTVINAIAQDAAGNNSGPATTTVDAVAPPAPVIDPSNGSVINGTAEAGATVILTDGNGDPIGQTTADGSGNWSFSPATPLPDGTVINAIAQDAAGNNSGPATTTVDAVAPPAPVIDPSNGSVINGTAEAGATVILTDGDGDPIGQTTADGSGNWSFTPGTPLPDGTVINAIAQDAAGNTSGPATTTVDAVAPPAPLLSVSADGTLLSGTAEPNSQVRIVVNGDTANPITVNVDGSGNFSLPFAPPLIAGELISAVAIDVAGNTSGAATINAPDLAPPDISVPEAADTWINAAEIGDGIQVDVTVRPTMQVGQVITVRFAGQNGYEADVSHTLTAADIAAGSVTVTLTPPAGMGPFPEGASTITAEVAGGTASAPEAFTIDTVPPATPVLSLVGNLLTISAEPGTELTVTLTVGGVTATATVTADNSGLASLNLLTDLDIDFTWDQLLNAQVSVVGSDPAGNPSNVASIGIGTSIEQPVTIGNFGVDVSLNPLNPRFGFSGTTEPDSSVVIRVITPALNVELLPIQADSAGNFSLNLLSPTILSQLGLNITDILNLGSQISFNLVSTDSNGNDSAAYGVTLSPNGLSLNIGQIDVNGTSGNDVLSGANGSSEHINGGDGSDLIFNVGSGDHVVAGNGDDAIQITATNFVSIDGGAGFDTLILANGIDLDYNSAGVGTLSNIERIDLGTGDSGSVLTLTAAEVAAITDGNDTLQITGESNDVLNVIGAVNTGTTQLINGVTYDVYTFGSTTLLVEDNSVQVVA